MRPKLVPWICHFISKWRQSVRYRGALSDWEYLTCGVAQGILLGPILFLALFDDALIGAPIPVWKKIDDINLLESRQWQQPSSMQSLLNELNTWSAQNNMLLNEKKCVTMRMSFSKSSPPAPAFSINITLAVQPKIKGLYIQQDLRWNDQVNVMTAKASRKLLHLKRIKRFSVSHTDLLAIYIGYIRPVLEYAVPARHPGLTQALSTQLEQVQKRACRIILEAAYTRHQQALSTLGIPSLQERREQNWLDFALSLQSSNSFDWLPHLENRYLDAPLEMDTN